MDSSTLQKSKIFENVKNFKITKTTFLIQARKISVQKMLKFSMNFFMKIFSLDDETEKKSVEHFVTTLTKCLALAFGPEVHQNPKNVPKKSVPKFKILEP